MKKLMIAILGLLLVSSVLLASAKSQGGDNNSAFENGKEVLAPGIHIFDREYTLFNARGKKLGSYVVERGSKKAKAIVKEAEKMVYKKHRVKDSKELAKKGYGYNAEMKKFRKSRELDPVVKFVDGNKKVVREIKVLPKQKEKGEKWNVQGKEMETDVYIYRGLRLSPSKKFLAVVTRNSRTVNVGRGMSEQTGSLALYDNKGEILFTKDYLKNTCIDGTSGVQVSDTGMVAVLVYENIAKTDGETLGESYLYVYSKEGDVLIKQFPKGCECEEGSAGPINWMTDQYLIFGAVCDKKWGRKPRRVFLNLNNNKYFVSNEYLTLVKLTDDGIAHVKKFMAKEVETIDLKKRIGD